MDDAIISIGEDRWLVKGIGNNKVKYYICPLLIILGLLSCVVFYTTGLKKGFSIPCLLGLFLGLGLILIDTIRLMHNRYIIIDKLNHSLEMYNSYLLYANRKTYDLEDVSEIKISPNDGFGLSFYAVEIILNSSPSLCVNIFYREEKAQRFKDELTNLII